jgi:hypothetical protein
MNENKTKLTELFNRIPRRHTPENVAEFSAVLDEYEDLLKSLEAQDEQQIAPFFDDLEPIRTTLKKSNDRKASKKQKDELFDEASGALKDTIQSLLDLQ